MNLELEGKTVIVTGGAKGIGAAIVRSFASEGAVVSIVDRNPDVADKLIEEIEAKGGEAFCIPTELTDLKACRNAVDYITKKTGGEGSFREFADIIIKNH